MIKVLVADDNDRLNDILCEYINIQNDMKCVGTVNDGKCCVTMVKSLIPDVLILDIVMPESDGLGVLRGLRNIPEKPTIIIVSALYNEKTIQLSTELGAEYFFRKPYDIDDLINRIRDFSSNKFITNVNSVYRKIDKLSKLMNISKKSRGYDYLKEIIAMYIESEQMPLIEAYKTIAQKCESNWRTIEKAVRRVILIGYKNQTKIFKELFGSDIPSTADFVVIFTDKCR